MSKKSKQPVIRFTGIVDVTALGLVVATLFGFLGRLHWFLDLFSHFRVQYMQLCLPIIGIYLWKRMNKKGVAMIVLAVWFDGSTEIWAVAGLGAFLTVLVPGLIMLRREPKSVI